MEDKTQVAFILGGTFKISGTRGPIGMKLWGYIELILRLCNVIFSTSGRKSKLEMGFANKKWVHKISVLFRYENFQRISHEQISVKPEIPVKTGFSWFLRYNTYFIDFFRPEVENMTSHNLRVNFLYLQSSNPIDSLRKLCMYVFLRKNH